MRDEEEDKRVLVEKIENRKEKVRRIERRKEGRDENAE